MAAVPGTTRVLFVDDEEAIRATLPKILAMHGYDVRVAATVAQALGEITSRSFDVLISDLNIGEPGDGFTVVSAMRRTQPDCVNLILTGYPALESALEAIRRQVDDYLIKPANVDAMLHELETRIGSRRIHYSPPAKRISELLRENIDAIVARVDREFADHPAFNRLGMSPEARIAPARSIILGLADYLSSNNDQTLSETILAPAAERGRIRFQQGFSIPLMMEAGLILQRAIFDVVQVNLMALDLSYVISDLGRLSASLVAQFSESLNAYLGEVSKKA